MPNTIQRNPVLDAAVIRKHEAEIRKLDLETRALERITVLEESKDHQHRTYQFWSDVSPSSARAAFDTLGQWHRQSPGEPFTLVFNSPGGGVIPGLALFDYIRELSHAGHHITTICIGYAASMGGVLLQAGDTRVMGKHAWVLIHEVGSGAMGKTSELEDEVKFVKRLQGQVLDILAERSTFSPKQIETRWKRKDWWINAAEALEGGFVDEVRS